MNSPVLSVRPFVYLILSSALSSFLLPDISLSSSPLLPSIPILFFILLSVASLVYYTRCPSTPLDTPSTTHAMAVGAFSAISFASTLLQGRLLESKLLYSLQIYLLPTLYLFPSAPPTRSSTAAVACSVAAFLAGLNLFGIPASTLGLLLSITNLFLDSIRFNFLAKVLSSPSTNSKPNAAGFLLISALTGILTTILIFLLSFLLPRPPPSVPEYTRLGLFLFSSLFSTFLAIYILRKSTSSLPAFFSVLPRNFLLLFWGSLTRTVDWFNEGGTWGKMLLVVLPVGIWGILETDADLRSLLPAGWRVGGEIEASPSGLSTKRFAVSNTLHSKLLYLTYLPLLLVLLFSQSLPKSLSPTCLSLPPSFRATLCPTSFSPPISPGSTTHTVDLVFSYYDEDLDEFQNHVKRMKGRPICIWRRTRVIVYNKGVVEEEVLRDRLGLRDGDEVIALRNRGREGGTYLKHILSRYNATLLSLLPSTPPLPRSQILADQTFFLQPHLAWSWLAQPRLELIDGGTGFAHLGPYLRSDCGIDGRGNGNYQVREEEGPGKTEWWSEREVRREKRGMGVIAKEIYNIFRGELCPPTGQLAAWSAQFLVSKRRILANPYEHYAALDALLDADDSHWIHQVWGPNQSNQGDPSNPAVGHALERAWPVIFGCEDPKIADECTDEVHDKFKCQCRDY